MASHVAHIEELNYTFRTIQDLSEILLSLNFGYFNMISRFRPSNLKQTVEVC